MLPILHRNISRSILRELGFSPNSINIVGNTSQWPDWYRWHDVATHSATPVDTHGSPLDPALSAKTCANLLQTYVKRILHSIGSEQLVWLGFALHLVQDLAAHKGRTNVEHGHEIIAFWLNPDWSPSAYRLGKQYSRMLLRHVLEQLDDESTERMKTNTSAYSLTPAQAETVLGPKDISLLSLFDFFLDTVRFLKQNHTTRRVRWDTDAVMRDGLS